jgi:hypothetical protein
MVASLLENSGTVSPCPFYTNRSFQLQYSPKETGMDLEPDERRKRQMGTYRNAPHIRLLLRKIRKRRQPPKATRTWFDRYASRVLQKSGFQRAITIRFGKTSTGLNAVKYGEYPPFGPPLPARLQRLFQGDVELLKKGFRAEKWGFGVAAFTYYRQVLERQRDRLFERIIEAAAAVNAPQRTIDKLKEAKSNRQFSTSLEQAKEVFPESLMIVGQNPMAVLHRVCSEAIHNHTDEECLDIAITTRKLLIAFSERLAEAIKSQTEIEDSLKKLMQSPKKLS